MCTFKKLLAFLLALVMLLSMAACGVSLSVDEDEDEKKTSKKDKNSDETEETADPDEKPTVPDVDELEDDDLAYVMIYNPNIYDENARADKSKLKTGYIGNQIEVDGNRADGLEQEEEEEGLTSSSQLDRNSIIPMESLNFEENRAGGLGKVYSVGDEETFLYDHGNGTVGKEAFECIYEGDYCYVWTQGDAKETAIIEYADEFDQEIYLAVTKAFGDTGMIDETGKINIVYHPMYGGLMGYFWFYELCTEKELDKRTAEQYGINLNHAMIHINEALTWNDAYALNAKSTLAHEFQHLIAGYDTFSTVNNNMYNVWINEAMSGYIEEQLYPGAKDDAGHYKELMDSDRIRNGQSLYNFATDSADIGVYGSVYCFTEFLANQTDSDVFSEIHDYWTTSYSDTLCTAEALYNAVGKSYRNKVLNSVAYSDNVRLNSTEEEFMSKLTLQFYLELLCEDSKVKNFDEIDSTDLVYDCLDDANIEGGGRIIVAVNGSFEFPDDADDGLVYVGLNSDFEVVTPIVCR